MVNRETLGHIDERQRNNGAFGIESWLVWVTHTFGMNGAFLESVTAGALHFVFNR